MGFAMMIEELGAFGDFMAIYFPEESVIASLTGNYSLNTSSVLGNITFPAGSMIVGNFTAFTLTSGAAIAYRAKPAE
jgi:hypothetical protein